MWRVTENTTCSITEGALIPIVQGLRTSQRSLHNAPIFRLLLKVAVNGTHQYDFTNFCGQRCPTKATSMFGLHIKKTFATADCHRFRCRAIAEIYLLATR